MHTPSAAEVVEVWERYQHWSPPERAVAIARLAHRETVLPAVEDESVGDRDRALLALRRRMFGDRLPMVLTCPACKNDLELVLSISALLDSEKQDDGHVRLAVEGLHVTARQPTSRDLVDAAATGNREAARWVLIERCVEATDTHGTAVPVGELPASLLDSVGDALGAADPLADVVVRTACAICGHESGAALDVPLYLWAEFTVTAQRVIWDVHALATAYGWRESDILEMSAVRRQAYLDLIP